MSRSCIPSFVNSPENLKVSMRYVEGCENILVDFVLSNVKEKQNRKLLPSKL